MVRVKILHSGMVHAAPLVSTSMQPPVPDAAATFNHACMPCPHVDHAMVSMGSGMGMVRMVQHALFLEFRGSIQRFRRQVHEYMLRMLARLRILTTRLTSHMDMSRLKRRETKK